MGGDRGKQASVLVCRHTLKT